MNMKQSCKALICAIEGELDGRHCTEEQAAAILDHAVPSLTEALARVEAERDTAIGQMQNIRKNRDRLNKEQCDTEFKLCIAKQQLAEAVGLLRYSQEIARLFDDEHTAEVGRFLARYAQSEQQEAQEVAPLKGEFAEAAEQAFREQYGLQEAQGAQAGDEQEALCKAIRVSAREFGDEADEDGLQRDARGDFVHVEVRQLLRICQLYRAALATQAAAGEPVAIANRGKCAFWVRWTDAAEGLYGPGIKLYAAPPAAAHGDEAVRKDAEYFRFIESCPIRTGVVLSRKAHEAGFDLRAECERVMAMRAQGDGEVQ